ncbi:hypothetical protein DYQ86_04920 [Acidobacteria bacterium AB60]|nr:hypothetical protein DYQ86_04920 [Acidobacteria bacterium AB60]
MAAGHILYAGDEYFHRAGVLRAADYEVEECHTLPELEAWFQAGRFTDLICVSESPHRPAEELLRVAHTFASSPVVLFRATPHQYRERIWDFEVGPLTLPGVWLAEVAELVSWSQAIQAKSAEMRNASLQLRAACEALRQRSLDLRAQVRRQRDAGGGQGSDRGD